MVICVYTITVSVHKAVRIPKDCTRISKLSWESISSLYHTVGLFFLSYPS